MINNTTTPMANTTTPLSMIDYFEANKLVPADLDIEVEYLMHEFLVNESLNMIFASAGQGKSFLVLAIATKLLQEGKISRCFYLDMDNSTMALKSRRLDDLLTNNLNLNYIHHSKTNISAADTIFQLAYEADVLNKSLQSNLIVLDSIRDFLGGRDMNADKDIIPVMNALKKLREAGATVVFLHHAKKDADSKKEVYKGSTSFIDSVDVAYSLQSEKMNANTLEYSLSVYKDRIPVNNSSFSLNTDTLDLIQQNYELNQLTQHQQDFIKHVENALEANPTGINQTNLLHAIGKSNDDKTARKYLQKFSGQFWNSKTIPTAKNSLNYFPLKEVA